MKKHCGKNAIVLSHMMKKSTYIYIYIYIRKYGVLALRHSQKISLPDTCLVLNGVGCPEAS